MPDLIPIPFIEVDPISGLPEKTSLEPGGHMLLEGSDGNTYRIRTEVFYQLLHSIASPISPSDTGPFNANSWYKPLVYSPDPGTNYPNAGDLKAIEKFDTLFYYNGTTWVKMANKLPGVTVAPEFDISNNEDAQAAKQINNWLVNDVEGGESDDVSQVVEQVGDFYKNIGIEQAGAGSDGLQAGLYSVKTNTNAFADAQKFLTKASIYLTVAGDFKFCIGIWDSTNNKFVIRWQSDQKTGVVGWNNFTFQEKINNGEIAGVLCLASTAAQIALDYNGPSTNKFVQYSTTANKAEGPVNSYYSVFFELKNIDIVTIPSDGKFNLAKSVSKVVADYSQNGYEGPQTTEGESVVSSDSDSTAGYAINKVELETTYLLEKIEINVVTAGSYKIAIGFLEQIGKFIEKTIITKTLVAGLNAVTLDNPVILSPGDYVGLKFPSKYPVNNAPTTANLWYTDSYTGVLTQIAGKSLPIKLFIKEYIESPVATKSDLNNVNASVNGLQQIFIHEGKKVGLIFNSDGSVEWAFIEGYSNILHLGNSIAKHPITSYWWGSWGMAASELSKDYVHRFLAKMQVIKPAAATSVLNIAEWEVNPSGWNKSTLDPYLIGKDLICVRLGENATYNGTFKTEFASLITYIKSKNATAKILIGGVFWADSNKDIAMSEVASDNSLPFVALSHLDIPANRSYMGAQVKGDDNQWHTVNNTGVAIHPGDLGMDAIATELFNGLGL